MNDKAKNIIVVVFITLIFVAYCVLYVGIVFHNVPFPINILAGIIPTLLAVGLVTVCVKRIHEIESGYTDDIDKY